MEPKTDTAEISGVDDVVEVSPDQVSDLDSLEAKLDKVLGDVAETIPVVEEKPVIPTFELGAPPTHTAFTEPSHTIMGTQDIPSVITAEEQMIKQTPQQESAHEQVPHEEGFHTISGGPETLKESMEKVLPAVHRMTPPLQLRDAVKPKVNIAAILENEKEFLSPALFFWFSAVTFVSFLVGIIFPLVTEYLLTKEYFLIEEGGAIYRNGTIFFPSSLPENMLTLTFQLVVVSIFVLIITGTVDYGFKRKFNNWMRYSAYVLIIGLISYVTYRFFCDQGVTFEQVRQVLLIVQNFIDSVLHNIREDKPVFD